jgi:hypothetical protein
MCCSNKEETGSSSGTKHVILRFSWFSSVPPDRSRLLSFTLIKAYHFSVNTQSLNKLRNTVLWPSWLHGPKHTCTLGKSIWILFGIHIFVHIVLCCLMIEALWQSDSPLSSTCKVYVFVFIVYLTIMLVAQTVQCWMTGWIMNWEGYGKNQLWLNLSIYLSE